MPFLSKAQERWAFTPMGRKALGGKANVMEWARSTNQSSLPERKGGLRQAAKKAKENR